MKKQVNVNKSTSFVFLLTLAFIVLKLCNVIKWSWFWVLSPMVFGLGLTILVAILYVIVSIKSIK